MEMSPEVASVYMDPKISDAIGDLYERIGAHNEPAIRAVTIVAVLDDERVFFGIDQDDTPTNLRLLTQAVTGQDPALPWDHHPGDERAPALRGHYGGRPVDLAIRERRRRPPDLRS